MADELDRPNPTVQSIRAQQILQAYQAYRQGATQAPSQPTPSYTRPSTTSTGPPVSISAATLARVNALRAEQDLPPLQEVSNVQVVRGTASTEPRQSVPQPNVINQRTGTLVLSQATLAKSDALRMGQGLQPLESVTTVRQPTTQERSIQASLQQRELLTSNLSQAKQAGVTSINIIDSKGNVVGTVNPQNVAEARLQTLQLVRKAGGSASLQYSTQAQQTQTGVTTTQTSFFAANPFTALVGGALGSSAELGLIALGGIAKLTGKDITIPGTNTVIKPTGIIAQAQQKVEKTFGKETLDQLISGEKVDLSSPIAIASLVGSAGFFIASGGTGAIKAAVKAPSLISEFIRAPGFAKAVSGGLQEESLLSQTAKVKGSQTLFEFEQGTAGKSAVTSTKMEDILRVERLSSGKVQATKPIIPSEIKITPAAKEGEAQIPYAVIGATAKGTTAVVTKGVTQLTPQEIAIKGLPPELGKSMGLKLVPGTGIFPVYAGKLTAKNIPILLEEIRVGQIKPSFDILKFFTKEFAGKPTRYGQMSRETSLLSSNAFESITRPSVMRYFESKLELEKEVLQPKPSGPMKPLSAPTGSTTVSGGGGRAAALTQEEKSFVQTITKTGLEQKAVSSKTDLTRLSARVGLTTALTAQQQQEEEVIFIQKGKIITKPKSIRDVIQLQKTPSTIKEQERIGTSLISRTRQTSLTQQTTKTTTKQKQVTQQITITKEPKIPTETTGITRRKPFGGGLIPGQTLPGALGKVSKTGARKVFTGNVPITSIVGIYKRSEITYGNPKAPKSSSSKKTYKSLSTRKSKTTRI